MKTPASHITIYRLPKAETSYAVSENFNIERHNVIGNVTFVTPAPVPPNSQKSFIPRITAITNRE